MTLEEVEMNLGAPVIFDNGYRPRTGLIEGVDRKGYALVRLYYVNPSYRLQNTVSHIEPRLLRITQYELRRREQQQENTTQTFPETT